MKLSFLVTVFSYLVMQLFLVFKVFITLYITAASITDAKTYTIKGCVRYIFARLFCKYKGEHL